MLRFFSSVALLLFLAGCTPRAREPLTVLQRVSSDFGQSNEDFVGDQIDGAHRFAVFEGPPEMRDAVNRLAQGWQNPDARGGVQIVVEPTRFAELAVEGRLAERVVRLQPAINRGKLVYVLRIDGRRLRSDLSGPPELALYFYGAAVIRDWYEEQRLRRGIEGAQLLDSVLADADSLMTAQYLAWDSVIERAYRPLRASGKIPAIARLDRLAEARARCTGQTDRSICWQGEVRGQLGLLSAR